MSAALTAAVDLGASADHAVDMAGPIALAAALSRVRRIRCPHCGQEKAVAGLPRAYRVCPRCHKRFEDPGPRASRTAPRKR